MKIPHIKLPIAEISAYVASFPVEAKGLVFQAVLNYGLYQKWDSLELPENAQAGYAAVKEIVENQTKSYKKFCKSQKEKIKKYWQENQNTDDTNVLPPLNTAVLPQENTNVLPGANTTVLPEPKQKEKESPLKEEKEKDIKEKEEVTPEEKEKLSMPAPKKQTAIDFAFEDFWKEFPKQRIGNKEKAKSAFAAAVKRSGMLAFQLVAKAREYAKSDEVARGFAKGAQAWLNDDRFLRSYTPGTGTSTLEEARENGYRIIDNIFGGK